jgi:hypothetical protein
MLGLVTSWEATEQHAFGANSEADTPIGEYQNSIKSSIENGVFWDVTPCGSYKNRRF